MIGPHIYWSKRSQAGLTNGLGSSRHPEGVCSCPSCHEQHKDRHKGANWTYVLLLSCYSLNNSLDVPKRPIYWHLHPRSLMLMVAELRLPLDPVGSLGSINDSITSQSNSHGKFSCLNQVQPVSSLFSGQPCGFLFHLCPATVILQPCRMAGSMSNHLPVLDCEPPKLSAEISLLPSWVAWLQ